MGSGEHFLAFFLWDEAIYFSSSLTNILAMDCAIICVIIKINMATNDVLIAFFVLILFLLYNFRFSQFSKLELRFHIFQEI